MKPDRVLLFDVNEDEQAVSRTRLVAAHAWDVAGALRAGAAAAFVARPSMQWNPLIEKPDVWGTDLELVADQIIARDA